MDDNNTGSGQTAPVPELQPLQGVAMSAPMNGVAELNEWLKENTAGVTFARIPVPLPGVPADGVPVAVVRSGDSFTVQSIMAHASPFQDRPLRRSGTAAMVDLDSFIAFVNEYRTANTRIFAKPTGDEPFLLAVLDYNDPVNVGGLLGEGGAPSVPAATEALPRWGEHRVQYAFPMSREWQAWKAQDGKWMNQVDFAMFIEERIGDIVDMTAEGMPSLAGTKMGQIAQLLGSTFASPSRMVELSRGLTIVEGSEFKSQLNVNTGETTMQFQSQHRDEAGQQLKVPNLFGIVIPIFDFGAPYQIAVRLRYRKGSDGLRWGYQLFKAEDAKYGAVLEAGKRAEGETGSRLYLGMPEPRQQPLGAKTDTGR